jgi:hypothetical protein
MLLTSSGQKNNPTGSSLSSSSHFSMSYYSSSDFVFYPEYGGSRLLQNAREHIPDYTELHTEEQ